MIRPDPTEQAASDDADLASIPPDPVVAQLAARFAQPVSGYAYGPALRVIALIVTLFSIAFAVFAWFSAAAQTMSGYWLPMAIAVGMIATCWYIVTGQTVLDRDGISQQWIMPKAYRWDGIYRARLLRLPMNTRLMLNVGKPPFKTIHAGTPELAAAFADIARLYESRTPDRSRR